MMILRNSEISLEQLEVVLAGRAYRVTGSPTIQQDTHPLVQVYVAETMHGYKDQVRFAHWRTVTGRKKRECVRQAVLARTES